MSYNTESFERLKALLGLTADTQEEETLLDAELAAYCSELGFIREELESALNQAFPPTMSLQTLDSYCRLFGISQSLGESEKSTAVADAFRSSTVPFSAAEFLEKAYALDEDFEPNISGFTLALVSFGGSIIPLLPEINRLLEAYVPACVTVEGTGNGRTFAQWDALDKTFGELDSMGLRYMTIETL
jgi:hypothetical protein